MSLTSWLRTAIPGPAPRRAPTPDRRTRLRVENLEGRALMSAGALDTTFGTGGRAAVAGGGQAVAVQSDGKSVVATNYPYGVERFNSDGTPDATFGTNGWAPVSVSDCRTIAVQADGKVLVAGHSDLYGSDTNGDFAVVRLNPNGTPDAAFGTGGLAATDVSSADGDGFNLVTGLVVQVDGKVVLGGSAETVAANGYAYRNFALVRFTATGVLDTAFGTGGATIADFGGDDYCNGIAFQGDGKVVAVGESWTSYKVSGKLVGTSNFAVARFNSNGTPDATFDGDGKVTTDFGSPPDKRGLVDSRGADAATAVTIQPDGKIVAVGWSSWSQTTTGRNFALARYNLNGSLDASFDGDGKVTTDFGTPEDMATGVAIQMVKGQTRIVVGGYTNDGTTRNFALARYNLNGSLDASFDGDGRVTTADTGYLWGIAIQPDGDIVAVGGKDLILVRYKGV